MKDNDIIQLYWDRNDRAIRETADKYGNYCTAIAKNILGSKEDAKECVNDAYLHAWNAMPEHWPGQLAAFLGKLTRNFIQGYTKDDADAGKITAYAIWKNESAQNAGE